MAFAEIAELFWLSKSRCTLGENYSWACNCTILRGDVWEVELGTVCMPIQAVTTRWHHDSGNRVQMNHRTKGILPLPGVCYKPRTRVGFANFAVNPGRVSPKCRLKFEQNGLSSRWQGGVCDLGWKPSECLTCNQADLGCGCTWRACVYLEQNLRLKFREYEPGWAKTGWGLHDPAEKCCKKVPRDFFARPGQ